MPLKPKSQQLSELFPVFVSHEAFGGGEKVVVYARNERVDVLLKCFGAFVILRPCLIEQRISVVKERGGRGDGVGFVVDHKAEIAVVPVCVADHSVKDQHIADSLLERFAEFFIIGGNRIETASLHQIADGHIGMVDVGKQLAGGAEPTFPLRQTVWNRVNPHGGGDLRGVVFAIWLCARVVAAVCAALVQRDLAADSAPALGQHTVCRKFRAGSQRRAVAASVAGEGDEGQHLAETVFKEIVLFKSAFKAFFDDPIAVIHGKPFAERENPHRAVGVQSAFCQKPVDVGAVAGDGAAAHPTTDPLRRQLHIQRQKMPLIFVDPMHFDFGRAGIVGRGKTQKRNVILLQNKFHIAASLHVVFLFLFAPAQLILNWFVYEA